MKVLFVHNSIPEYRIEFWKYLSKSVDLTIAVTDREKAVKVYGMAGSEKALSVVDWNSELLANSEKYDAIVLPSADDLSNFLISLKIISKVKSKNTKLYYWNEKWEPKRSLQPTKKRIKNDLHALLIKKIIRNVDAIICSGTKSKEYTLSLIGNHNCKVFVAYDSSTSPDPKSVNSKELRKLIDSNKKIVLYLGRLIQRKGVKCLIQAFNKSKTNDSILVIAGDGEQRNELENFVIEHKIENVDFVGRVEPDNRKSLLQRADLFVLPSIILGGTIEAWGLTVNEALESGTPVVTTNAVGSGYDLVNDKVGEMVRQGSVEELSRAITVWINKKKDVSGDCINQAKLFSVRNMADSFAQIFITEVR